MPKSLNISLNAIFTLQTYLGIDIHNDKLPIKIDKTYIIGYLIRGRKTCIKKQKNL